MTLDDDDANDWVMMRRFFAAYSREQQMLPGAPPVVTSQQNASQAALFYLSAELKPGETCHWRDEGLGEYTAHYHEHPCTKCKKTSVCFYKHRDKPHETADLLCRECSPYTCARGAVVLYGPIGDDPSEHPHWRLYVVLEDAPDNATHQRVFPLMHYSGVPPFESFHLSTNRLHFLHLAPSPLHEFIDKHFKRVV